MSKLRNLLALTVLAFVTLSCSKSSDANFTLTGHIKGLKKGIVYLQKEGDSSIIDLDSMTISGEPNFTLQTTIEEPILLYLKLFKNDGEEHFIPFFADKGTTEINTSLKLFNFNPEIKGSKAQELLNEYTKVMSKYNNQNLELIKAKFVAQKDKDSVVLDSLSKLSKTLYKRKYSYTIQFALNHKDHIIAPYLALYEIPEANPVYIDSVYNVLNKEIKNSYYGKKLGALIASRTTTKE